MVNKKALILNLVLILLIIFIILFGAYFLYLNLPGEPENLTFSTSDFQIIIKNQVFAKVSQFYPNMKFNHNSISYKIDPYCGNKKRQSMISAFNDLSSKIKIISFYEVFDNPDIEVSCSENKKESVDEKHFIAGEGGAKEIVQTERYNIITNGTVLLYKEINTQECNWANIELHELIHVFGFGHSNNSNSLMYPYIEGCNQELDGSIIIELIRLYSEENLADLYFSGKNAIKKGRYLDFNLSIKNSGSIVSEKTNFKVLEDGKLVKEFDLDQISYGGGIVVEIKNLKLNSRNPKEIKFVIDKENLVKEIDEENNIAIVSLD